MRGLESCCGGNNGGQAGLELARGSCQANGGEGWEPFSIGNCQERMHKVRGGRSPALGMLLLLSPREGDNSRQQRPGCSGGSQGCLWVSVSVSTVSSFCFIPGVSRNMMGKDVPASGHVLGARGLGQGLELAEQLTLLPWLVWTV